MRWSAWPKETGSKCAVEVADRVDAHDGELGTKTVFFSKGKQFGYQEIVELETDHLVRFKLDSKGPPHTPTLTFYIDAIGPDKCLVRLHFVNLLPRPFNALWRFAGLSKWTRSMQLKDLASLKAFSEPPHLDADGRIVGRVPTAANPYAFSG